MQDKTSSPNLSDREIVDLFWNRNESAIPETDRKYGEELFRIAYRILSDPSECEACKNEIYLKVWNSIPPARPDVLASYLSRLIRNVALDRYREREFRARLTSDVTEAMREYNETIPDEASVSRELETQELGKAINGFVEGLSPLRRALFVSRYYYGKTVEEIAAYFSISTFAVYRALKKIRKDLKNYLKERELYHD